MSAASVRAYRHKMSRTLQLSPDGRMHQTVVGKPVDIDLMVAAFIQDLAKTRDLAQYHRSSAWTRQALANSRYSFVRRLTGIIGMNKLYGLPTNIYLVDVAGNRIEPVSLFYEWSILPVDLTAYRFYEELHEIWEAPFDLPRMDANDVRARLWKTLHWERDEDVQDSEDEELSFGVSLESA